MAFGIKILEKAKIKPTQIDKKLQKYKQIFELSETRIRIELMNTKIFTVQTKLIPKALNTLTAIEKSLLKNKSSISLTFLADISEQKGNLLYKLKHLKQ